MNETFTWRGTRVGNRGILVTRIFVALTGLTLSLIAHPVWAQDYKSLCNRAMSRAEAQKIFRTVGPAIRNPAGFGEAEDAVKNYFLKYYFMKMTCYKQPEALGQLGKLRENLFRQYIRGARNAESQRKITQLAYRASEVFAKDNYHPAVRYNATLIIGNLDSKYSSRNSPPVPLPEATNFLLDLMEEDSFEAKDGKLVAVHPSVKSGALVGLERHARYGVDPKYAERFTKVLTDFVAKQEREEEISKKVHHWMKCQALAALVQQAKAEPTPTMQQTLVKAMGDQEFSLEDRCYIAGLMQKANYENAQGIDGEATVLSLAKLSQDVMDKESELAKEFQQERLEGGGGGGGFAGGRLFGGRNVSDNTVKYGVRRLLSRLRAITEAGSSVSKGVAEDQQAKIAELLNLMQPIRQKCAESELNELSVAKLVVSAKPEIDRLVSSWTGGEAGGESEDNNDDFAIR